MGKKGYLAIVLHAHLPYIRHPENEFFLEERWLYEAITETYIPLIDIFERLEKEGVDFALTISLSHSAGLHVLLILLLQQRYLNHLNKQIELADKEVERTSYTPFL